MIRCGQLINKVWEIQDRILHISIEKRPTENFRAYVLPDSCTVHLGCVYQNDDVVFAPRPTQTSGPIIRTAYVVTHTHTHTDTGSGTRSHVQSTRDTNLMTLKRCGICKKQVTRPAT